MRGEREPVVFCKIKSATSRGRDVISVYIKKYVPALRRSF